MGICYGKLLRRKILKDGCGKIFILDCHIVKILTIIYIALFASTQVNAYADPYEYLRELSVKQIQELDSDLMSPDDLEYLKFIFFSPIKTVIPYNIQQQLMQTAYPSMEKLLMNLGYCKLWDFKVLKWELFQGWPLEVYRVWRMEIGSGAFETYIVYMKDTNTYHLLALDGFAEDQFNRLIDVSIDTSQKALDYAVNVVALLAYDGFVVNEKILTPTWFRYHILEPYINQLFLPKISVETDDDYVAEMFLYEGNEAPDLLCKISKITILIKNNGKVAILKELLE